MPGTDLLDPGGALGCGTRTSTADPFELVVDGALPCGLATPAGGDCSALDPDDLEPGLGFDWPASAVGCGEGFFFFFEGSEESIANALLCQWMMVKGGCGRRGCVKCVDEVSSMSKYEVEDMILVQESWVGAALSYSLEGLVC